VRAGCACRTSGSARFELISPLLRPPIERPPSKRADSTLMQRSTTTSSPASSAMRIASSLITPYWNQIAFAPTATASRATDGASAGLRKTSTISGAPRSAAYAASVGYEMMPSIAGAAGLIGETSSSPFVRR
jgi:hypothetical protein